MKPRPPESSTHTETLPPDSCREGLRPKKCTGAPIAPLTVPMHAYYSFLALLPHPDLPTYNSPPPPQLDTGADPRGVDWVSSHPLEFEMSTETTNHFDIYRRGVQLESVITIASVFCSGRGGIPFPHPLPVHSVTPAPKFLDRPL